MARYTGLSAHAAMAFTSLHGRDQAMAKAVKPRRLVSHASPMLGRQAKKPRPMALPPELQPVLDTMRFRKPTFRAKYGRLTRFCSAWIASVYSARSSRTEPSSFRVDKLPYRQPVSFVNATELRDGENEQPDPQDPSFYRSHANLCFRC